MKAPFFRLRSCAFALLSVCAAAASAAQAADASRYPTKPIRMIVPFPPGGSNDILARFLAQKLFNQSAKVKLTHVAYRGGGPSMLGVMTGEVEIVFGTLIQALPHIRSGKLKPLGVGSQKRSPILPQVPAIAETLPGYDGTIWWGVLAPAGVPRPIVARLNAEVNAILREPEMAKRLSAEAA